MLALGLRGNGPGRGSSPHGASPRSGGGTGVHVGLSRVQQNYPGGGQEGRVFVAMTVDNGGT